MRLGCSPFALAVLLTAPLAVLTTAVKAAESTYTPIGREACAEPPPAVRAEFAGRGLGVQECPSVDGWRLLFVSSDANSWPELRRGDLAWSAEEAVVYGQAVGNFPNVAGSPVVEWRRDARGRATALIFRIVAQARDDPERRPSRLLVVRLLADSACLIGQVATNEEAHALADGSSACPAGSTGRGD